MKQPRNPESIHAPLGRYVHQIEVSGEGRMLFLAGQVGIKPDGTVPADPVDQLRVALENIVRNLGEMDAVGRRAQLDRVLGSHLTTSTLVYDDVGRELDEIGRLEARGLDLVVGARERGDAWATR